MELYGFRCKAADFWWYEVETRSAIGALLQAKVFHFNQCGKVGQVNVPVSWSFSQVIVVALNAVLKTRSMVGNSSSFQMSKML